MAKKKEEPKEPGHINFYDMDPITGKRMNIYQRVSAITGELQHIPKEEKPVSFKNTSYPYVSHDTLTTLLQPYLIKFGVVIIPSIHKWGQNGNRTEVEAKIDLICTDNPVDQFSVLALGFGVDSSDKGPGKALSYAVKSALLKVFCLATGEKDVDAIQDSEHKATPESSKPEADSKLLSVRKKLTKKQIAQQESITKLADKKGFNESTLDEWLTEHFGVTIGFVRSDDTYQNIMTKLKDLEKFEVVGEQLANGALPDDVPF